jgi:UTP-glucose-1-phosphate uridylyltransferase
MSLENVISDMEQIALSYGDVSVVTYYQCPDSEVRKTGILELGSQNRVIGFLGIMVFIMTLTNLIEKPDPESTSARNACPCFYRYNKKALSLLSVFLAEKEGAPLSEKDAPGKFLCWLYQREPVFAVQIEGRLDVGGLESYLEADMHLGGHHHRIK